jgi:ABC-type multidrug transport system fused ATPase/permease subunit
VLKGIDLDIPGGCHVGLCGRTGSGKSSVLAALTRLVEPCGGSALIDGVDIAAVPLHTLRSRLTVISQDPLFFSGTLRRNLDPFGEFSDGELTEVLRQVGLYDFAVAQAGGAAGSAAPAAASPVTPSGAADASSAAVATPSPSVTACTAETAAAVPAASLLDIPIAERGSNLSAGEQQLLAAARAWLRRPRVCLCDEMSSNLDVVAEEQLQRTLHACFAGATVVQIAHRLVSVIESHLVVVLSDGLVEEAGCPWDLLQHDTRTAAPPPAVAASTTTSAPRHGASFRCTGLFANMVAAMPPAQRKELHERARQAYLRDADWMHANMPHLLAGRPPHS